MTGFPRFAIDHDESTSEPAETTITASSTPHALGSWVEVQAATAFDTHLVRVQWSDNDTAQDDTSALLNIGYDAAGGTSYTVVIPDILIGHTGDDAWDGRTFAIPCFIPRGSTVAAQTRALVGSQEVLVSVSLFGGGRPVGQGLVVPYGTVPAASGGTSMANASADTKGAWTQLVAATTHPHRGLAVAVQGADAALSSATFLIDIGVGDTEVVVIPNVYTKTFGSEEVRDLIPRGAIYRVDIPEGTKISARSQGSQNNVNNNVDVAVYGWGGR